jgi:hypothetical protein
MALPRNYSRGFDAAHPGSHRGSESHLARRAWSGTSRLTDWRRFNGHLRPRQTPHDPIYDMQFIKPLRDRIRNGEITCTVRLWQRPHVRVGGRYALPPGDIRVTGVFETTLADVTPALARQSGFASVVELLKVAKHGAGRRVFVIEFRYVAPSEQRAARHKRKTSRG